MIPETVAHLDFCVRLHRALAPEPDTTVCWSPYSVAAVLDLAATGARGRTRAELHALLAGETDPGLVAALLAGGAELEPARRGGDAERPVLAVADTLWADASIPIRAEFAEQLRARRTGGVREAPFAADPDAARRLINDDVADTTRGLIEQLLPPGTISARTRAVLVNALYLKTAWQHPFGRGATKPRPFHAPSGREPVPTMQATQWLGYARRDGWQAVGLAAAGGVQAVVLLPDSRLAQAEQELTAARLGGLLDDLDRTLVRLSLPTLRVRTFVDLKQVLAEVGVRTLFTDDADLSGISDTDLAVSDALHEAVLAVDEDGLEGAAATAMVMRTMSAVTSRPDPVEVQVDRPFLLLVRHPASGAVHFMARVTEP